MPVSRRSRTPLSRGIAAIVATITLVVGGSLASMPAYAAGPTLYLDALDSGNAYAPVAGMVLTAVNVDTSASVSLATDASGEADFALAPGNYNVTTEDDGVYKVQSRVWNVPVGGGTTHSGFSLTKRASFTGTIPADAVGHTTISAFGPGASPWAAFPSTTTWVGNVFTTVINDDATNQYDYYATLFFDVDDSVLYRDTYLGGRTTIATYQGSAGSIQTSISGPVSVGAVGLIAVGKIHGHVTGIAANLAGATAKASSDGGTTVYTATTDASGNYVILVPSGDATYATWASAAGYADVPVSTSVALNSGNSHDASGIDFTLHTGAPTASGNAVDQAGHPVTASYYLYEMDPVTGRYGSADYQGESATFSYSGLGYGTYRLALRDTAGTGLPITSYSSSRVVGGATVGGPTVVHTTRPAGDCYIQFTTAADEGDYTFADVATDTVADATVCDQSASSGTFAGTVTNAAAVGSTLTALLYRAGDRYNPIDSAPVDSAGNFVVQGVANDDDYFVLIHAGATDAWLDTFTGDVPDMGDTVVTLPGVTLTAGENSTGNDVTMVPATVFTGVVTSNGTPVEGACVAAVDNDDSSLQYCDPTDASGTFHVKVPLGHDYTLRASQVGYNDLTYADPNDSSIPMLWHGTVQGTFYSLDFDLTPANALIYGHGSIDPASPVPADGVTVHLYAKAGSGYGEVATYTLDEFGYFAFDEDHVAPADNGLAAGDYRVRFEDTTHHWLSLSDYTIGTTTTAGGGACYFDVPGIAPGPATYLEATLDTSGSCTAEPAAAAGTVTGTLVESAHLGGAPIESQTVQLVRDSDSLTYTASTDAGGEFSIPSVQPGIYSLTVPTGAYATGTHVYVEQTTDSILVAGGATIPPTTVNRYGNVSGTVMHWVDDPSIDPTTVSVYAFDGVEWSPVNGIAGVVAADGSFEVPGVDIDDDYALYFDGPDNSGWLDGFPNSGADHPEPGTTFSGTAEDDINLGGDFLAPARQLSGTVTDDLGHPVADVDLIGIPQSVIDGTDPNTFTLERRATSDALGHYTLKVADGVEYEILASSDDYLLGYWGTLSSCGCGSPEVVPANDPGDPPVTGLNITLYPLAFDVYTYTHDSGTYPAYPGVTTHLYKKVTGGYQEIGTKVGDFAGYSASTAHDSGDYRLRFSIGSTWLPVQQYFDYSIDNDPHTPDSACYYDVNDIQAPDFRALDFQLDSLATPGTCTGEPTIAGSGGAVTPPHHHSSSSPTQTATPTATPTPTPTPTASAEPTAPTEPGRPDKPTTPNPTTPAPGIAWWVWLLAALGVLIVGGCGFFILRRR